MAFSDFVDSYLDTLTLSAPVSGGPRTSTTITVAASGAETRNINWQHPLRRFVAPEAIREQATLEAVLDQWLICSGPALTFPFTDPTDFASCPLPAPNTPPVITAGDQFIATGDGLTAGFQLQKLYTRALNGGGQAQYLRPIYLPQLDTVLVEMGASGGPYYAPGDVPGGLGGPYTYEVSRPGGVITFSPPAAENLEIYAGFLFDVQVRFEQDDSFDGIVQAYQVAGFATLTLVETRPC